MSGGFQGIRARRASLVERAAIQRNELTDLLRAWGKPLGMVDRGLTVVRTVRKQGRVVAVSIGAALAVMALARRREPTAGLRRGLSVWRVVSGVWGLRRFL